MNTHADRQTDRCTHTRARTHTHTHTHTHAYTKVVLKKSLRQVISYQTIMLYLYRRRVSNWLITDGRLYGDILLDNIHTLQTVTTKSLRKLFKGRSTLIMIGHHNIDTDTPNKLYVHVPYVYMYTVNEPSNSGHLSHKTSTLEKGIDLITD